MAQSFIPNITGMPPLSESSNFTTSLSQKIYTNILYNIYINVL